MTDEPFPPETTIRPKERDSTRTRRVPIYNVILDNDDFHSFEFVVEVIHKAMGYNEQRAKLLTLAAHTQGRAVIWSGSQEVAELKVEQILTFHEVRDGGADLGPLSCAIEPAPGS